MRPGNHSPHIREPASTATHLRKYGAWRATSTSELPNAGYSKSGFRPAHQQRAGTTVNIKQTSAPAHETLHLRATPGRFAAEVFFGGPRPTTTASQPVRTAPPGHWCLLGRCAITQHIHTCRSSRRREVTRRRASCTGGEGRVPVHRQLHFAGPPRAAIRRLLWRQHTRFLCQPAANPPHAGLVLRYSRAVAAQGSPASAPTAVPWRAATLRQRHTWRGCTLQHTPTHRRRGRERETPRKRRMTAGPSGDIGGDTPSHPVFLTRGQ